MNEFLKESLYDLVVDVVSNGMIVENDKIEIAYENGKLITIDEFKNIFDNSNIKRFLNIELRYEEGKGTVKWFLKQLCNNNGMKLDNAMITRIFKITKEIVNEMMILSDRNEKDLIEIKNKYNIICNDVMQYALYVERCLIVETEQL